MSAPALVGFLLARIAEDEAATLPHWGDMGGVALGPIESGDGYAECSISAPRVLAECQAKRALIEFALEHGASIDGEFGCCHDEAALRTGFRDWGDGDDPEPVPDHCFGVQAAQKGLLILAGPYADHPDYREEWRG